MRRARQVLKNTVRGYITKDVGKRAASLTYYLLFAIFPFLVGIIPDRTGIINHKISFFL